jgi:hypothetical protein
MNERNDTTTFGVPNTGKSPDLKRAMWQYALSNMVREYQDPFTALDLDIGSDPSTIIDFHDLDVNPIAPRGLFTVHEMEALLRFMLNFDDRTDTSAVSNERYNSLLEALEANKVTDPQVVKDLAVTALTPLREEAQNIAIQTQHEGTIARREFSEEILGPLI